MIPTKQMLDFARGQLERERLTLRGYVAGQMEKTQDQGIRNALKKIHSFIEARRHKKTGVSNEKTD